MLPTTLADPDAPVKSTHECRGLFPFPGTLWFAGLPEPVVVLGLAGDDELRVIRADGSFGTVRQHRVQLDRRDLS